MTSTTASNGDAMSENELLDILLDPDHTLTNTPRDQRGWTVDNIMNCVREHEASMALVHFGAALCTVAWLKMHFAKSPHSKIRVVIEMDGGRRGSSPIYVVADVCADGSMENPRCVESSTEFKSVNPNKNQAAFEMLAAM